MRLLNRGKKINEFPSFVISAQPRSSTFRIATCFISLAPRENREKRNKKKRKPLAKMYLKVSHFLRSLLFLPSTMGMENNISRLWTIISWLTTIFFLPFIYSPFIRVAFRSNFLYFYSHLSSVVANTITGLRLIFTSCDQGV